MVLFIIRNSLKLRISIQGVSKVSAFLQLGNTGHENEQISLSNFWPKVKLCFGLVLRHGVFQLQSLEYIQSDFFLLHFTNF